MNSIKANTTFSHKAYCKRPTALIVWLASLIIIGSAYYMANQKEFEQKQFASQLIQLLPGRVAYAMNNTQANTITAASTSNKALPSSSATVLAAKPGAIIMKVCDKRGTQKKGRSIDIAPSGRVSISLISCG